jgi:hypothetical protein
MVDREHGWIGHYNDLQAQNIGLEAALGTCQCISRSFHIRIVLDPHQGMYPVSPILATGAALSIVCLAQALSSYRHYLSLQAPSEVPASPLGPQANPATWRSVLPHHPPSQEAYAQIVPFGCRHWLHWSSHPAMSYLCRNQDLSLARL